jgi:hypothetical protein
LKRNPPPRERRYLARFGVRRFGRHRRHQPPPLGTKPSFSLASDLQPEAQDNPSFSWAPKIVLSGRQKDLYFSMSSDFSFFVNIYISEN